MVSVVLPASPDLAAELGVRPSPVYYMEESLSGPHTAHAALPRNSPDSPVLLILLCLLLALIAFVIAPSWYRSERLAMRGQRTRGAVREVRRTATDPPVVYEVVADFRVEGRAYRVSDQRRGFFGPLWDRLRPGDSVAVLYLPEKPQVAAVSPLPDEVCRGRRRKPNCPP